MDSPVGQIRLVATEDKLVGVYLPEHKGAPESTWDTSEPPDHPILHKARAQLTEYFDGRRQRFDLPLAFEGTDFQKSVWAALTEIPFGETRSYFELARHIERPRAVRAVGSANGRNPISIIVPCHRVVGSGGALTGYAGGVARKKWLLDHEDTQGALLPPR